jgi:conjugal transfer pilus assembly protein TrbC
MTIRVFICFLSAFFLFGYALISPAQEQDPFKKSQEAIERAMEQALQRQAIQLQNGPKEGLSPLELRKMKGIDPAKIAQEYQSLNAGNRPTSPSLMVFVSTSMPMRALEMLGRQAKTTGAVLLIRGLRDPLGTKGAMSKTREFLAPVMATGAVIQIDPEAFARYDVTAVPTFVMTSGKKESCGESSCDGAFASLVGDVTLEYALEYWSGQGGALGQQADVFLRRLERDKP